MNLKDDTATASKLFGLLNYIVDRKISQPNQLKAFYDELPRKTRGDQHAGREIRGKRHQVAARASPGAAGI